MARVQDWTKETTTYRFFGAVGPDTVDSASALIAWRIARMIAGEETSIQVQSKQNGMWLTVSLNQIIYGPDAAKHLRGAYGFAGARAIKKAEKEFGGAA